MKNEHAVALGSIKSKHKSEQARLNGKLGGRPKKPMEIPLTQGYVALVDKEDYAELIKYKWHAKKTPHTIYAQKGRAPAIKMHNFIMQPAEGLLVDHIDNNGLNNTRKNLRICTNAQNLRNRGLSKNNTSGFKGVHWNKRDKKWTARITINHTGSNLGVFTTAEEAYKAYCEACIKYHGEFANLG